jgi:adhesin HecA-like repeat protein
VTSRDARRTSLRTHLIDASEHLRLAARSLDAAAGTIGGRGARRLHGLAVRIAEWASRVDPRTIEQRARRAG